MAETGDWKDRGFVAHYNTLYGLSESEARPFLTRLDLKPSDSLVDFGCGDGSFLALTAPLVAKAVGVDGSPHQVELARQRLKALPQAEVVASGFLDFDPAGRTFTKAFSRKALHHLTDPEKQAFLRKVGPSFSAGALFLIEDGMFTFRREELAAHMPQVLSEAAVYFGEAWGAKQGDFLHLLREEHATGQDFWVEALAAAGFLVLERWNKNCFLGGLLAAKEAR